MTKITSLTGYCLKAHERLDSLKRIKAFKIRVAQEETDEAQSAWQ